MKLDPTLRTNSWTSSTSPLPEFSGARVTTMHFIFQSAEVCQLHQAKAKRFLEQWSPG